MNPAFTPRHSHQPEQKTSHTSKKPDVIIGTIPWWQWLKPRLITTLRWCNRHVRKLVTITTRYVRGLTRTQRIQHAAIILGLIMLCFIAGQTFSRKPHPSQTAQSGTSATLPKETPSFSAILPSGKSATDYGGWTRVSPSDRNAVYAYTDTIDGTSIIVSEQPLPDDFKSDPDGSVQKLAESFSADRTLSAGDYTVYIGKSAKGPQSLIFTTHSLLVLIKSSATVSDDHWVRYIKSLQ